MTITKTQGMVVHDTLNDLRFTCKMMADLIIVQRKRPLITLSRKVLDGRVSCHELNVWYPKAVELLRRVK